ncbi:M23 family metallopeptidase [Candidatus Methanocrinis natronophilus]|uniref:M23 family metallopeptidase n=1 Tax=Candidatus Methanocrinis natronophilus TaxID=3033396 RepID=A0ABT5X7W6_9EURY|nr:M23 family metallopeptidase [Candidatus Methanocrinis natronophilus]MDF0590794.1 M23 family metallopeptidase [Candidatus Methanocrinis natronophilus]
MTGADLCRTNEGVWPLPGDLRKAVHQRGEPGSFLEDRGDRRHCGVDIYAPQGSQVVSITDGLVFDVGVFTEPGEVPYWKKTFYVVVQGDGGLFVKYAELGVVDVRAGESIRSGERLGRVGSVLDPEKIDDLAPGYIRRLQEEGKVSMLHLELYRSLPEPSDLYRGGNWFGTGEPGGLIDPTRLLAAISKR